jgi:hypothetical protein
VAVTGATFAAAAVYVVIVVIAIRPTLGSDLGLSLSALRCEAILLSILVFLAVNLAWLLMVEDAPE